MHPSWTGGGNYQQTFETFLKLGPNFSTAFSGKHSDATFLLAYQGIGALLAIVAVVLAFLCSLSISGQVERDAGARIGFVRRPVVWALDRVGGGRTQTWPALAAAAFATGLCSGAFYNWFGRSNLPVPERSAVTTLIVTHTRTHVTARFNLNEAATVSVKIRPVHNGRPANLLNAVSHDEEAGQRSITLSPGRTGMRSRAGATESRSRQRAQTAKFRSQRRGESGLKRDDPIGDLEHLAVQDPVVDPQLDRILGRDAVHSHRGSRCRVAVSGSMPPALAAC